MYEFRLIKINAILALVVVVFSGCRFWQKSDDAATPSPTPFIAEEIRSDIPFATKEPEVFQVEIVITANGRENKIFLARNKDKRRYDADFGTPSQVTNLTATSGVYKILPGRKIYTDNPNGTQPVEENNSELLSSGWLAGPAAAKFFNLGAENELTKYRVVLGEAENAGAETIIFVDEKLGLPVRQEFYSLIDGQRTLTMTVELKNLKLEAEDALFVVPADYKKVSTEEFSNNWKKADE